MPRLAVVVHPSSSRPSLGSAYTVLEPAERGAGSCIEEAQNFFGLKGYIRAVELDQVGEVRRREEGSGGVDGGCGRFEAPQLRYTPLKR
jgi:hypothetical protein